MGREKSGNLKNTTMKSWISLFLEQLLDMERSQNIQHFSSIQGRNILFLGWKRFKFDIGWMFINDCRS